MTQIQFLVMYFFPRMQSLVVVLEWSLVRHHYFQVQHEWATAFFCLKYINISLSAM